MRSTRSPSHTGGRGRETCPAGTSRTIAARQRDASSVWGDPAGGRPAPWAGIAATGARSRRTSRWKPRIPDDRCSPIPDRQHVGVTTYDAKDPDTSFPPITPVAARRGRPNVLVVLLDDAGFGSSSTFGGPVDTRLRPSRRGRPALHPLPHHRPVLADPAGAAHRPQPPLGGDGRDHRDRHVGTRLQLGAPEEQGAAGRDPEAQRVLHRPVRQVPRGAGVGDQPDGPFTAWPTGGGGFEHFYGFIGAETNQWAPAIYRDRCRSSRTAPRNRATTSPRT